MKYRGKFDNNKALIDFCDTLERVCVQTVESGFMTKDLALLVGPHQKWMNTQEFLDKLRDNLDAALK